MKRISIILLVFLFLLSSCRHSKLPDQNPTIDSNLQTPAIDTTIYTAENPYVLENIRLTDEESLSSLVGFDRAAVYPNLQYNMKAFYDTAYIIRKKSSQSYYWEEGEKHVIYTDSVVEIKDKIFGNSDKYSNSNVGDELQLIEFFSKSPTGEIWSSLTEERNIGVVFALKTYRFNGSQGNGIDVLSSSIANSGIIYGSIDHKVLMSPLLKFDTYYLLLLKEQYLFTSEDQLIVDTLEPDSSEFVGKYVKYSAYELNENAYDSAIIDLQNYKEKNGEERYYSYVKNTAYGWYNKMVADAWETYGDRVTE